VGEVQHRESVQSLQVLNFGDGVVVEVETDEVGEGVQSLYPEDAVVAEPHSY
jgi:hypothetical protein